ncbi:hypothetical protein V8C86DRAFT_2780747 [Haematococcus lacustris]
MVRIILVIVLASALVLPSLAKIDASNCARQCHEIDCDKASIRYGKFCGIGHGGCPGEAPCDGVDACCRKHGAFNGSSC